jgi:ribosomal protein S18 acetylase RimI-like enzyme
VSKSTLDLKSVSLRPVTDADHDFLRAVFAGTREAELAHLGPDQARAFIDLQFRIQQQNYLARYPSADNNIILAGDEPVGRLLVSRQADKLVLVDIAIRASCRNRGIGTFLINELMKDAEEQQVPLTLSVFKINPAFRLYERLGFSVTHDEGMYLEMSWRRRAPISELIDRKPSSIFDMTTSLTQPVFAAQLNTKFRILMNDKSTVELELVEVGEFLESEYQERFSIKFSGPVNQPLAQSMYSFAHDVMGEFKLFIVPIESDNELLAYEAVFNRLRKQE